MNRNALPIVFACIAAGVLLVIWAIVFGGAK